MLMVGKVSHILDWVNAQNNRNMSLMLRRSSANRRIDSLMVRWVGSVAHPSGCEVFSSPTCWKRSTLKSILKVFGNIHFRQRGGIRPSLDWQVRCLQSPTNSTHQTNWWPCFTLGLSTWQREVMKCKAALLFFSCMLDAPNLTSMQSDYDYTVSLGWLYYFLGHDQQSTGRPSSVDDVPSGTISDPLSMVGSDKIFGDAFREQLGAWHAVQAERMGARLKWLLFQQAALLTHFGSCRAWRFYWGSKV